jgi:3-hydroxyacyl-[acyl-carrier-protein] dehydratase
MIDIHQILKLIPHRYPLLLVDKVIEIDLGKSIKGIKNVTINEPQFVGHFPSNPVMPGVLIVEALAQISAILVAKSMDTTTDKEVLFLAIDDVRFRKVVTPGDSMVMYSEIVQQRGDVWKFRAKAEVNSLLVAEGSLMAMVQNKNSI